MNKKELSYLYNIKAKGCKIAKYSTKNYIIL